MRSHFYIPSLVIILFVLIPCPGFTQTDQKTVRLTESFSSLPLYFIENQGQGSEAITYYVKGLDKTLFFHSGGVTFAFAEKDDQRWALKLDFLGARSVEPRGRQPQEARINYFKGQPEDWQSGIATYGELIYEELWPGIDLVYTGSSDRLKYAFRVAPGANPDLIRLAYRGATSLGITGSGSLRVETPAGGFEDETPVAFQWRDGEKQSVTMGYVLDGSGAFHFELGEYDSSLPLVLDPAVLVYCGYIGGAASDSAKGVSVDGNGNVYVTGYTYSNELSFPETAGPDLNYHGISDAFIAKIKANGSALVYCGYIGGDAWDQGEGVVVASDGSAYLVGSTKSDEGSFPVLVGPDLTYNGVVDIFVAKVKADGTSLDFCGYIGGLDYEYGSGIALDTSENIYLTGITRSNEYSFPVTVGPDLFLNGGLDTYVIKVNHTGTGLDYCGYLGGAGNDFGFDIAVDSLDRAYVTGYTSNDEATFPVIVGPDVTFNGGSLDAYVARVKAVPGDPITTNNYDYCGYLGGIEDDHGYGIDVDAYGSAFLTGNTLSDESSFPVTVGPDLTYNGTGDGYVAKVADDGTGLVYCGYIGGSASDSVWAVAVDHLGKAYVTGLTESDEVSFPLVNGPDFFFNGGLDDAFVAKINITGTKLLYSGYIGGAGSESAYDITVDADEVVYVTGVTDSSELTFPVLGGLDNSYNGGSCDVFVAKVEASNILRVPKDYATIQEAITASKAFGIVEVAPGTYVENLLFGGKRITVKSTQGPEVTVIDGNQTGSVVVFIANETRDSVLEGFTLTNGSGSVIHPLTYGGAIFCNTASPTIRNNIIRGNSVQSPAGSYGGGICLTFNSTALIVNNVIRQNSSDRYGGGIYTFSDASPVLKNNRIYDNSATRWGGGVYLGTDSRPVLINNLIYSNTAQDGGGVMCVNSLPVLVNNTIHGNAATVSGGGVYCFAADAVITNSIIWGNTANLEGGLFVDGASPIVTYCDVQGFSSGSGNMGLDPLFVDALAGDFHLTAASPCIDMGDNGAVYLPKLDFEMDFRVVAGKSPALGKGLSPLSGPKQAPVVDMGADEFSKIKARIPGHSIK